MLTLMFMKRKWGGKMITKKEFWVTPDGEQFDTESEAVLHQEKVNASKKNLYDQFLKTYSGSRLLETHNLNEVGIWEVRGEDPNPDFGGHHHEPYIGTYKGKLVNVIKEAVESDRFWQWGAGGSIKKIEIKPIKEV